ncbi:VirB4 family type IV secretion system protein [Peribacillus asahii]|uniref:VirB4 family type IV secretion system protein n=1 Tax=Peribacillus asahii TaxID=228899 RepID=UPI00207A8D48|nr:DUF87 domain-containing protein [Peribacillus asahii]USK62471.1 DUF87 domain-containing protein [Peribacillus asahii]
MRKKRKKEPLRPVSEEKELSFPSLVENSLNDGITFHEDFFKIQTGLGKIKYARTFFVKPSGYPRTVRINWLEGLFLGDDLDCAVHIEPFERTEAIRQLKDKIDKLEAVYLSAQKNGNGLRVEETFQKIQDCKFLRNQIRNNQNGLYYVSIQATIYADTLNELNQHCVDIERTVKGESIELVTAYGRQREGWLSTLPLGRNYLKKSSRNLDQLALTAIFPHTSSKLSHTGGIPIGRYGSEYVYYNNFDSKLNNYGMGIFGESGAGKSVFVKQIIGRGFMDGISRVVCIDVEPEYTGLTRALGGIVIEIRADEKEGTSRINPLDIYVEREIENKNTPQEYTRDRVNLPEKVKEAIEFFKVMKESTSPDVHASLTPTELAVLDEILMKLYTDIGITEDPDSLYELKEQVNEEGKLEWVKKYRTMPTISDVYNEVARRMADGNEKLENLLDVINLFVKGKSYGLFDGQTRLVTESNVTLDTAPIVTFDISKLSRNGIERPIAQHVLMSWIWNRFVKNDPKTKKRIMQDEAWMTLKYPSMVNFFLDIAARGRKWNTSLTLVSQRYEMFHRTEGASDVLAQLNTVAFLKQSDQDIELILDTFRFSDEVGQMMRTFETGDVLLKAGKEVVTFRSEPTPDEWVYLNTNQNVQM